MLRYALHYHCENNYHSLVKNAFYKFLIFPYKSPLVRVESFNFSSTIEGDSWQSTGQDPNLTEIYFKVEKPFKHFHIDFNCTVEQERFEGYAISELSAEEETLLMKNVSWLTDNYHYIFSNPSRKSYLPPEVRKDFPLMGEDSIYHRVVALSAQIHQLFKYEPGLTNVETTAVKALKLKAGVCQDIVHVFLGVLRNHSIPCRYVSGYLHAGGGVLGALQLHAWAEFNLPSLGWIGIDPTNQLLVDHNYIKICHGYDYDECLPVAGVITSDSKYQTSQYAVSVQQLQQNQ